MKKFVAIAIHILLIIFFVGCGTKSIVKLSSANRSTISALQLMVEHSKKPTLDHVLGVSTLTPSGKIYKRIGPTKYWPDTRFNTEMEDNRNRVEIAINTHFPDEELSETIIPKLFSDLANSSDKIKIVSGSSKHDALLEIRIYYKAGIGGIMQATPETYAGARIRIKYPSGQIIYDRVIFSDRWHVTDKFLDNEIRASIEKFIRDVVIKTRNDIIL